MINDVYNAKILEFAGNISRIGRLENPTTTAKRNSRLCGSSIIVDLRIEDDLITDYAHLLKACALGQAGSSIMARVIIGCRIDELTILQQQLHSMLADTGPPPVGKFEEFRYLQPVKNYKSRHASTLLSVDAVCDAINGMTK